MTECERILSKGLISKSFLNEETRCDYFIDEKMKKVWAVYLDMLVSILEVTRKYHLRCWMAYGSLLGTIRHGGFVPWDDDLDIWMPRPDYEILIEVAPKEFKAPYFLQTTLNDDDYYNSFARLRNSNTTGILVSHHNRCNNGIFLDIFPLDGEPDSDSKFKRRYKWIKVNNSVAHAYTFNINPNPVTRFTHAVLHLPFVPYSKEKTYLYTDKMTRQYSWKDSEYVGTQTFTPYRWTSNRLRREWFDDTIEMPFESFSVPVPAEYDKILTAVYGDYMKFPPVEKRGQWHNFILEPEIPYEQYMIDKHLLG